MRKMVVTFIIGIALGAAPLSWAVTQWSHTTNGVWCKTLGGNGIGCVLTSGKGYGVAISRDGVIVARASDGKVLFKRYQP